MASSMEQGYFKLPKAFSIKESLQMVNETAKVKKRSQMVTSLKVTLKTTPNKVMVPLATKMVASTAENGAQINPMALVRWFSVTKTSMKETLSKANSLEMVDLFSTMEQFTKAYGSRVANTVTANS